MESSFQRHTQSGVAVSALCLESHRETFLTAVPAAGESPEATFARAAGMLRDNDAQPVSQQVFGGSDRGAGNGRALEKAMGCTPLPWPVTWVEEADGVAGHHALGGVGGTQVWAVSGAPVESVALDGRVLGRVFEDAHARYCRLGGIVPADPSQSRETQTRQVFERIEAGLGAVGMDFSHVVRLWFFNDDILDWYGDFNKVRDVFFRARGVFDGLVPASTGMGGSNAAGAALVAGVLAVKAKGDGVRAVAVPSPLQCPALEYGSAFSRAVELTVPGLRRLFVSGTASISPEGETLHVGDVDGQIALTMDVVNAILESRGMTWSEVTRAVVYFKRREDFPRFAAYCMDRGLPTLPAVLVQNDVCRDDLLFEIEVDAVLPCSS